jgi:hypothetical protein
MRCLDDDVVRDATIEQMSQAVFSAGPLRALGGLYQATNQAECSQCGSSSVVQAMQLRSV